MSSRLAINKFLSPLILTLVLFLLTVSCQNDGRVDEPIVPVSVTDIAGTWKSSNNFYLIFDVDDKSFSFADTAEAAKAKNGPHGNFTLTDNELHLTESENSLVCPNLEAVFQIEITRLGNLRLTIVEDPCIYRVEGVFQGGQGGNRFLDFRPVH
ncbi:MAG: hypothetical protein R3293_06105 [Candidatus Promineifilaceae bacterium]|nr:hypothetical protein [Candidatus Promineifilaceae bacterium]